MGGVSLGRKCARTSGSIGQTVSGSNDDDGYSRTLPQRPLPREPDGVPASRSLKTTRSGGRVMNLIELGKFLDRRQPAAVMAALLGGAMLTAAVVAPGLAAEAVKQGLKLAFFCSGGDNDYQLTGIRAAKETAAKYGASIQYYDAHFDNAKQLNQIMSAISSGNFQGFVIEAINPGTVCSSVKAALAKNIVVAMTKVQACDTAYEVPFPGTVAMV